MHIIINTQHATIHNNPGAAGLALEGLRLDGGAPGVFSDLAFGILAPDVGEPWEEEGGHVAGKMPAEGGEPAYWLIVPVDPASRAESLKFGGYGKEIAGLGERDGKKNTELLLASGVEHPAAKFCSDVRVGQHSDFYLPSNREASLIRATVPHLMPEGWHWTSTQYSASTAYVQSFRYGTQSYDFKDGSDRVLAVRRVLIPSPIHQFNGISR